jgi:hypothetical protein
LDRPSRQFQTEIDAQPVFYLSQQNLRLAPFNTEDYEIVNITDILVALELALNVLIEWVEVDERQQL